MAIEIKPGLWLNEDEIEFSAIRAQGAGGQNVNKVSSAIHLRFDIAASSLSAHVKEQLVGYADQRITKEGVIVIKAQTHRTQEKNRDEALARLAELVLNATHVQPPRRATRPTLASKKRRQDAKSRRGNTKKLRQRISDHD